MLELGIDQGVELRDDALTQMLPAGGLTRIVSVGRMFVAFGLAGAGSFAAMGHGLKSDIKISKMISVYASFEPHSILGSGLL